MTVKLILRKNKARKSKRKEICWASGICCYLTSEKLSRVSRTTAVKAQAASQPHQDSFSRMLCRKDSKFLKTSLFYKLKVMIGVILSSRRSDA